MSNFASGFRRAAMSSSKPQLLQGVFGIHKPSGITSAQVLRDIETHFNPSPLFRPLLDAERAAAAEEKRRNKNFRRKKGPNRERRVKLGHGGTLDPLASGVLVAGVGSGTKALGGFLGECRKTYEATVLFGCATDTYDNTGKVIGRAPSAHVTREGVAAALQAFKGAIMQKPPVYSAIKFDGKKAYEIMREGGQPPEMKERPVTVFELELVEWMEPGTHMWRYPTEELDAAREDKDAVLEASTSEVANKQASLTAGEKRKREGDGVEDDDDAAGKKVKTSAEPEPVDTAVEQKVKSGEQDSTAEKAAAPATEEDGSAAPAALIRMNVSSGFYVRTLCHDLGAAVNSLGCMTYLVRTQQADFELGKNVLEYDDLQKGEEVWGPQVKRFLEDWTAQEQGEEAAVAERQRRSKARSRSPEKTETQSESQERRIKAEKDREPELD